MRLGLLLCGLVVGLPAQVPGQPDEVVFNAKVNQAKVVVRCHPSEAAQSYPTNQLKAGDDVSVVKDDGEWLKILPPKGSFSWINKRFVEQVSPNNPTWVVKAGQGVQVPVIIGSELKNDGRPTTSGANLKRGAIVVSIGPAQADDEGSWLPIEPPPGEYRYIRAASVTKVVGTPSTVVAAGPSPFNPAPPNVGNPGTNQPALTIPSTPATGGPIQQKWERAVRAEQAGNLAEAILLYTEVGTEGAGSNHQLAMQALNRAYQLRQGGRGQTVQGQPTSANPTPPGSRFTPTDPAATTAARPSSVGGHPYTTPAGILRDDGQRVLEKRRVLMLVTRDGQPITYVIAGHQVDLSPYVNREVVLQGQGVFRDDLRTNLIVVERVLSPR